MNRITCSANYHAENCGDFCGFLPREGTQTGSYQCDCHLGDCNDCPIFVAFKRLKEYEDTGYSPKGVLELANQL